MTSLRNIVFLIGVLLSISSPAQDTFYVKKKNPPVTQVLERPVWDSTNTDSIVSYTVEFQRPGTNIWVVLHEEGPELSVPSAAYGQSGGTRVWFRDIIAVDQNGQKYKQPDRMWKSGIMVTLEPKQE